MPKASKFSPDGGLTIYDLKDSEAVHYGDQSKGYVGKNRLIPSINVSKTIGGVSVTVNEDKSLTYYGTKTGAITEIERIYYGELPDTLNIGKTYKATGFQGNIEVYMRFLRSANVDDVISFVQLNNVEEREFTIPNNTTHIVLFFVLITGNSIDKTYYPMIRLSSIVDKTYEPYLSPNTEIDNKSSYKNNTLLGAKNILKIKAKPVTAGGITAQYYDDGTVFIADGQTSTSESGFQLIARDNSYPLPIGKYILSGSPLNSSWDTMCLYYHRRNSDDTAWSSYQKIDYGDGVIIDVTSEVQNYKYIVSIRVPNNYTVPSGGLLFKPMLRPADDTDKTYAPYAMTNRELTKEIKYYAGDIITVRDMFGHITAGTGQIQVFVSGKFDTNISSVTIAGTDVRVRGTKGYVKDNNAVELNGKVFADYLKLKEFNVKNNQLTLVITTLTEAAFQNADNNTPLSFWGDPITITLA